MRLRLTCARFRAFVDGLGSILGALSQTVSAEVSSQACMLLQMLIDDNNAAKVRLLRARHESSAVLEFAFKVFCKVTPALRRCALSCREQRSRCPHARSADRSACASLARCSVAGFAAGHVARELPGRRRAIPGAAVDGVHSTRADSLVRAPSLWRAQVCTFAAALDMALQDDDDERARADGGAPRTAALDAVAADVRACQALCGVLLVLCLDFHPGDEAGVPRSTLADLIVHKVGIDEVQALVDSLAGSVSLSASVVAFVSAAQGMLSRW